MIHLFFGWLTKTKTKYKQWIIKIKLPPYVIMSSEFDWMLVGLLTTLNNLKYQNEKMLLCTPLWLFCKLQIKLKIFFINIFCINCCLHFTISACGETDRTLDNDIPIASQLLNKFFYYILIMLPSTFNILYLIKAFGKKLNTYSIFV